MAEKITSDRIEEAFNKYQTEEGREYFSCMLVCNDYTSDPKYIELALRRCEEIDDENSLKKLIEKFSLPEERLRQGLERIAGLKEQSEQAEKDYEYFMEETRAKYKSFLEKALEKGYELNSVSAQKAEEKGDFEVAFALYLNLPEEDSLAKENIELKPVFRYPETVARWALKNGKNDLYRVWRKIFDKEIEVYDKINTLKRNHARNHATTFRSLGEYDTAVERTETNIGSIMGGIKANYKDVPLELFQRYTEMLQDAVLFRMQPISDETLDEYKSLLKKRLQEE